MADPSGGEREIVAWLKNKENTPPDGDTWIGDDTAVISTPDCDLLFATDAVVEGVHFLAGPGHLADAGWKAIARNVSDVAAMGGTPTHAVVAISGASSAALVAIDEGLQLAVASYGFPIVGGDLSGGSSIVITVSILGRAERGRSVLRSGAHPGDQLFVTGPLGAASAGLRALLGDPSSNGPHVEAHRRPHARLAEGQTAASAGATAMIDLSDGLGIDLHRLADASNVGFAIRAVPIAPGATLEDALAGGEDYELLFSAAPDAAIDRAFDLAGLAPPRQIGVVLPDEGVRLLDRAPLPAKGWEHDLG